MLYLCLFDNVRKWEGKLNEILCHTIGIKHSQGFDSPLIRGRCVCTRQSIGQLAVNKSFDKKPREEKEIAGLAEEFLRLSRVIRNSRLPWQCPPRGRKKETTTEKTQKQSLINHFQLKFSTVKMHVCISSISVNFYCAALSLIAFYFEWKKSKK